MKKLFFTIFSFFALSVMAFGDEYEPTSTWPYVYQEFVAGKLEQPGGGTKDALFNICLTNATLHFIEGDMVREVSSADIFAVRIGNDYYVNAGGEILKVLSKSEKGMVVEQLKIDYAKLNSTQGAYGSSGTTIATNNLSSLEGIGASSSNMNMTHTALRNSRNEGKILPLIHKLALFVNNKISEASPKGVEEAFDVDKNAFKLFQKENKIKWRDAQSVQKVVDFLAK